MFTIMTLCNYPLSSALPWAILESRENKFPKPLPITKVLTMRRHQTNRYDLKAYEAAMREAAAGPQFTPAYLAELQRRMDQYQARLAR